MKSRVSLVLLLFVSLVGSARAQSYPVTDSFSATGPISSNWTNTPVHDGLSYPPVALVQAGGTVVPSVSGQWGLAGYTGVMFSTMNGYSDQIAQVTFVAHSSPGSGTGPCARVNLNNGNAYCYAADAGVLMTYNNGIWAGALTTNTPCPIPSSGDVIQISAIGTTITCTDVTTGVSASATDTTYWLATGIPGIVVDQQHGITNAALSAFTADCVPTCFNGTPGPAGTPVFNPAGATYYAPQTVTITSSTFSPTIYYTTDGSTPTTSSTPYAGPVTVSSGETLMAIATATNYTPSAVGTAVYVLTVAAPTVNPAAGNYTTPQTVTFTTTTPGATIHYTTDGSVPTASSPTYSIGIPLSAAGTVSAIGIAAGYTNSTITTAAYTFITPLAATPTFNPVAGIFNAPTVVTISSATSGATIYYTTDGSVPTTTSPVYSAPVMVSANETINAIATASGFVTSATGSAAYTFTVGTPTFSPGAGVFNAPQSVTISSVTPGTTIYYTTDGMTPTTSSTHYTAAVSITPPATLEAIAVKTGYADSAPATAVYTFGTRTLTSIAVAPQASNLKSGSTQQFTAECDYSDGSKDNCAAVGGVTWTSSALTAMTVDSNGLATWNTDPGQGSAPGYYVIVSAGGMTDKANVNGQHPGDTWYQYPTPDLTHYGDSENGARFPMYVAVGSTVTIGSAIEINDAHVDFTGQPFQTACNWSSSDITIATVDRHGQVTALAPGNVTITCGRQGNAVFGASTMPGWETPGNVITLDVVPGGTGNTTWYVLPGGGTLYTTTTDAGKLGQCNGQVNQTYAAAGGTGVNQPCGVGNIRYLWSDEGTYQRLQWSISGGDTVMVAPNLDGYNVGLDVAQSGTSWSPWNCAGSTSGCEMPTIPSGTAERHTRILGTNYQNCHDDSAKSLLIVSYGAGAAINVRDSQFVDVACFDITDKAACGGGNYDNDDCPAGANAGSNGLIQSALTASVNYSDLFIHGLSHDGIYGATGVGVVADYVHIRAVINGGIDMDDDPWNSGNISVAGGFTLTNSITEWTGCIEEYPITHNYPLLECRDANTGAYGDGFSTASTTGDWVFDHDTWQYNFQDGIDLLHTGMQNLSITNSFSQANEGQSFKIGSGDYIVFQNNLALGNCFRIGDLIGDEPASAIAPGGGDGGTGYSLCRAAANVAMHFTDQGTYLFQNNTVVSTANADSPITLDCEGGWDYCQNANAIFQNNITMGYKDSLNANADGKQPALFYLLHPDPVTGSNLVSSLMPPLTGWHTRDHNIFYNTRDGWCPPSLNMGESCPTRSPMLIDQPVSPLVSEQALDDFNFTPSVGSPAIGGGIAIAGLTTDYNGNPRANPPTIGAIEVPTTSPPVPSVFTVTVNPNSAAIGTMVTFAATIATSGSSAPTGTVTFMNGANVIGSGTLNNAGEATYSTSSLAAGTYLVTASYLGDSAYQAGVSTPAISLTVTPAALAPTTTTLLVTPDPAVLGAPLTLTATVAPTTGTGTPTGTVTFYVGTTNLGTGALIGGVAICPASPQASAQNSFTVLYSGDTNFATSTSTPIGIPVTTPVATSTQLTASPNPIEDQDETVTLTATVTLVGSSGIPPGVVTFYSGMTVIGTATLNSAGVATYPAPRNAFGGSGILTAVYSGVVYLNGTEYLASTSNEVTEFIVPLGLPPTPTLTATPNTANVGDLVTLTARLTLSEGTLTGAVTFYNGTTALNATPAPVNGGIATYSTSSLPVGTNILTAVYSGDANFPTTTSTPVSVTVVSLQPPLETFTATPNPANLGAEVTLQFTANSGSPVPTGTVIFYNGTIAINTSPVAMIGGVATYTTTSLPVGSNTLTAVYSGDTNYPPQTSSPVIEVINASTPPSFQISSTDSSMTIAPSSTGTMAMTTTAVAGYTGTVNLTCTTSSSALTCNVAPASAVFSSGGATTQASTLSVTTAASASVKPAIFGGSDSLSAMLALLLPGSLLGLFGLRRRGYGKKPLALLLLLAAGVFGMASLMGCGSGSNLGGSSPAAPRSYTVMVTASDGTTSTSSSLYVSVQ